ncbi:hypothetical protein M2326_002255 [Flavobacterium sp. 7A]|nr:hypothetical protein [Flavobacterium sp. 7A]
MYSVVNEWFNYELYGITFTKTYNVLAILTT